VLGSSECGLAKRELAGVDPPKKGCSRSIPTRHMHGGGGQASASVRVVTGAARDGDVTASAFALARKLGSGCRARRLRMCPFCVFWLGLHAAAGEEDPFSRIRIRSNCSLWIPIIHYCSLSHLKRTVMLCFCRGTKLRTLLHRTAWSINTEARRLPPLAAVNWEPRFGIPSSPIIGSCKTAAAATTCSVSVACRFFVSGRCGVVAVSTITCRKRQQKVSLSARTVG
jgi:hypothetical protein